MYLVRPFFYLALANWLLTTLDSLIVIKNNCIICFRKKRRKSGKFLKFKIWKNILFAYKIDFKLKIEVAMVAMVYRNIILSKQVTNSIFSFQLRIVMLIKSKMK